MDQKINKYSNYTMLVILSLLTSTSLYNKTFNKQNVSEIQTNNERQNIIDKIINNKVAIITLIVFIFMIINCVFMYSTSNYLIFFIKSIISLFIIFMLSLIYGDDNETVNTLNVILIIIICIDLYKTEKNIEQQEE